MANEKTRADSLRLYLTGAGADGGAQADPNLSFGNFRSGSLADLLGFSITNPIGNITVDFVAAENGEGIGTLTASGVDELKWTPPGGVQGAGVTILNGQTRIIEGTDLNKWVRVTRTTVAALAGAATITTADIFNDLLGFDNVSSVEAAAGDTEYRAYMLRNENANQIDSIKVFIKTIGTQRVTDTTQLGGAGAGTIETTGSFADWPSDGYGHIKDNGGTIKEIIYYSSRTATVLTVPIDGRGLLGTVATAGANDDTIDSVPGIRIAKEAPNAQPAGFIQTIANEDTAPGAVVFNSGILAADGVDIGSLATLNIQGLWIEREIIPGAIANVSVLNHLIFQFDA